MKKIGFSYMAYWGDQFEDIASGNNFFLADFISGLFQSGYKVYSLQKDLDNGEPVFKNFLAHDRKATYEKLIFTDGFPELDILLIEWRWKMPGRNWMEDGSKPPMDDFLRQQALLEHYHNTDTKIFIMDSDHQMTREDEERWSKATILTFAEYPKEITRPRKQVYWPFNHGRLLQREHMVHKPWSPLEENVSTVDPNFILSYIGNRYDRDEQFDFWLGDLSEWLPEKTIHIYGNWTKYPDKFTQISTKYPDIMFHTKVTKSEMEYIYSKSIAVPLLAKDDYNMHGHMTHRLLETMYCGSIPIGFATFSGIEKYLIDELIVSTKEELKELIKKLLTQTKQERIDLWKKQVNHFEYYPKDFIKVLES